MFFQGAEIHLPHRTSARTSLALHYVLNKPLYHSDLIGSNLLKLSISQLPSKNESTQEKKAH